MPTRPRCRPPSWPALIGDRVPEGALTAALDTLQERALVWGDGALRVVAEAPAALPWYPGQVTLEDTSRTVEEITAAIDAPGRRAAPNPRPAAGRLTGRPDPRRRPRHTARPARAAAARRRAVTPRGRRDRDPAAGGGPGAARRAAGVDQPGRADARRVDNGGRPCRRGRGRRRDRPAPRHGADHRNPRLRTGSRAAQRRPWGPRSQTADQADGHRRAAAGPAPGNRRRGGADRCRALPGPSRSTATRRTGRRPSQADRFTDSPAAERWHLLATTWLDVAGAAGPGGPTRARQQTHRRTVGCVVLHRRAARPAAASRPVGPAACRDRARRCGGVADVVVATSALVTATAAGAGRRSASTRRRHWAWWAAPR